jgi:hypothetical protein
MVEGCYFLDNSQIKGLRTSKQTSKHKLAREAFIFKHRGPTLRMLDGEEFGAKEFEIA